MANHLENLTLTRRGILTVAASAGLAGWSRLYAGSPDFWNRKDPSDWSRDEIEQLTTRSPWAKEATAQFTDQSGQSGQNGGQGGQGNPGGGWGGGMPRIGGLGIPGMGIPGMGGGRRGGQPVQTYRGTIRWESAKPVLAALKTELPEAFAGRYVISVSGIPLNPGGQRGYQDDSDTDPRSQSGSQSTASQSTQDMLDRLKSLTTLEPKSKSEAQPGVVQQQASSGYGSILFGFSKDVLALKPEDKEVTFSTQLGRTVVRAKFTFKDMLYRGDLAV